MGRCGISFPGRRIRVPIPRILPTAMTRLPHSRRSPPPAPFVSRGDKSGTDALEKRLWRAAGIDPARASGGSWYRDIGGGMCAVLNTA